MKGPQTEALSSKADILFYGGAAGGGKTDLLIGAALTKHKRSIIYRRESVQLQGIYDRIQEMRGTRDGFNSQDKIWTLGEGHKLEFGSCQHSGDEQAYQGRPHDLKAFDEITHFLESQFRFLIGWLRSNNPKQRKRVICAGNPPTDSDGDWVIQFWGPWLDPDHPNPAKPGELRWFTTIDGKDKEVPNGEPVEVNGRMVKPLSRTFIPSKVTDNPYMVESGYESILQALPEPLRSQMLEGKFGAGKDDDPWQVIPTDWVKAAQDRWKPREPKGKMNSMGVDVARGGRDKTVIAKRHGNWYDTLKKYPGESTPNGPAVAALCISERRSQSPIHVDIIGVGSSVYDFLDENNILVAGVNATHKSVAKDESGQLGFFNYRSELYWKFREALDPKNDTGIALPKDSQLRQDLCAPRWKLTSRGIQVESKEELIKRLGRSPDDGDAVIYASIQTEPEEEDYDDYEPRNWMSA